MTIKTSAILDLLAEEPPIDAVNTLAVTIGVIIADIENQCGDDVRKLLDEAIRVMSNAHAFHSNGLGRTLN